MCQHSIKRGNQVTFTIKLLEHSRVFPSDDQLYEKDSHLVEINMHFYKSRPYVLRHITLWALANGSDVEETGRS